MSIIAWIILGAIAGYLAGFLVKGDEGLGVIGHIVLGIVGALVGGFLASALFAAGAAALGAVLLREGRTSAVDVHDEAAEERSALAEAARRPAG